MGVQSDRTLPTVVKGPLRPSDLSVNEHGVSE